jgi:hypothetical protein
VDKTTNFEWDIVSTQEWLQLGRLTQRSTALFDGVLAYKQWCEDGVLDKIMTSLHRRVREQVKKKPQWTTLIMIDSQAVKNTLLCWC